MLNGFRLIVTGKDLLIFRRFNEVLHLISKIESEDFDAWKFAYDDDDAINSFLTGNKLSYFDDGTYEIYSDLLVSCVYIDVYSPENDINKYINGKFLDDVISVPEQLDRYVINKVFMIKKHPKENEQIIKIVYNTDEIVKCYQSNLFYKGVDDERGDKFIKFVNDELYLFVWNYFRDKIKIAYNVSVSLDKYYDVYSNYFFLLCISVNIFRCNDINESKVFNNMESRFPFDPTLQSMIDKSFTVLCCPDFKKDLEIPAVNSNEWIYVKYVENVEFDKDIMIQG